MNDSTFCESDRKMNRFLERFFFPLIALLIWTDAAMTQKPTPKQFHALAQMSKYSGPLTFLFSFPRSGNTWLRYCLEFLTQRPSFSKVGHYYDIQRPLGWAAGFVIDTSKAPIIKAHAYHEMLLGHNDIELRNPNPETDTLIFILRNPKETFARIEHTTWHSLMHNHIAGLGYEAQSYFDGLELFDAWPAHMRLLIYYEDFLTSPRETLMHILNFLDEPLTRLDQFMDKYEMHRQQCLALYPSSLSKGADTLFHSKKTSLEFHKLLDEWIQKAYPYLWHTYLEQRYAMRT